MRDDGILNKLKDIVAENAGREARAARAAEAIREAGAYRWVGIYVVDIRGGLVSNFAWSGPNAPAYPTFPATKGLTSRAIAGRKTINVGDVSRDTDYLTALGSTRSEIIVPVLNTTGDCVLGTIDVESEHLNAFDFSAQALLEECAVMLRGLWVDKD
jgi:putative methionine-R-sulfoxide reductase with GAF domain